MLRHVSVMNLMLILFRPLFKGENSTSVILLKQTFKIGLYSDMYRPISFKLGMIKTTMLYILISDWMTLTFIQGRSCMRN